MLRSNLMRLYFPVDLTGNLNMIEKLVLGEIWTGDLQSRRANLCAIMAWLSLSVLVSSRGIWTVWLRLTAFIRAAVFQWAIPQAGNEHGRLGRDDNDSWLFPIMCQRQSASILDLTLITIEKYNRLFSYSVVCHGFQYTLPINLCFKHKHNGRLS